jgi:hypothetical protein
MSWRSSPVVLALVGVTILGLVLSTQFQFEAIALQQYDPGDPGDHAYGGGGGGGGFGISNGAVFVFLAAGILFMYLAFRDGGDILLKGVIRSLEHFVHLVAGGDPPDDAWVGPLSPKEMPILIAMGILALIIAFFTLAMTAGG